MTRVAKLPTAINKSANVGSTKQEDFKRLASKRVNNALKQIELVGNLSNRTTYAYEDTHVRQIFKALQSKLDEAKAKFSATGGGGSASFVLE